MPVAVGCVLPGDLNEQLRVVPVNAQVQPGQSAQRGHRKQALRKVETCESVADFICMLLTTVPSDIYEEECWDTTSQEHLNRLRAGRQALMAQREQKGHQ